MSNFGLGILGLGELQRAETAARTKADSGMSSPSALQIQDEMHQKFVFRAKSQVHGDRAALYAHDIVEDRLISALKAVNPNHPLASKEAVEAALDDEFAKALVNPEVIKRTYPDGKLPDGAVIPPDQTLKVV